MKRRDLIQHLKAAGCEILREGGNHTIYINRSAHRTSAVPRHREINDFLAKKICKDLEVEAPR
ncbi:MAG: type II toxin-antitoxin system HicA family toxin [Rhodothermia bacterium]